MKTTPLILWPLSGPILATSLLCVIFGNIQTQPVQAGVFKKLHEQAKEAIHDATRQPLLKVSASDLKLEMLAATILNVHPTAKLKTDNRGRLLIAAILSSGAVDFVIQKATTGERESARKRADNIRERAQSIRSGSVPESESRSSQRQPSTNGVISRTTSIATQKTDPNNEPAQGDSGAAEAKGSTVPHQIALELPADTKNQPEASTASAGDHKDESGPRRFVLYDLDKDEIIGDEVYEAASRPRNEETIVLGDLNVPYVRAQ